MPRPLLNPTPAMLEEVSTTMKDLGLTVELPTLNRLSPRDLLHLQCLLLNAQLWKDKADGR